MSPDESGIFIRRTEQMVEIRVIGRGAFQNSRPLRRCAAEMIQRGHRQFMLDLDQCAGMDSTFLGVLTGIGLALRQQKPPGLVQIINANRHNRDLLQSLWLDRLFRITATAAVRSDFNPAGGEFQKLPDSDLRESPQLFSHEEARELVLTAHTDLIQADSRNAPKFAEVTHQLRKEEQPPGGNPGQSDGRIN